MSDLSPLELVEKISSKINTPYREESPRIYDDSILYFSSNGFAGYGKADIFKCKISNDSIYDVEHLPYPINSAGDDIHFVLHPFDESIAILNSNRSAGKGEEDIYFAHMIPISPYVKGYVRLTKKFDSTAFTLSQENNLPIVVFNMNKTSNLLKLINGTKIGTSIKN